jgi:hypothetical protein
MRPEQAEFTQPVSRRPSDVSIAIFRACLTEPVKVEINDVLAERVSRDWAKTV